jgi:hypothetical protein
MINLIGLFSTHKIGPIRKNENREKKNENLLPFTKFQNEYKSTMKVKELKNIVI